MLSNVADISLSRCTCGYYQLNVGSVTLHLEDSRAKALLDVMQTGLESMSEAEQVVKTEGGRFPYLVKGERETLQ